MQRFLDTYWILYFIGYVIGVIVLGWHYWDELWSGENWIFLTAAIFGTAAGAASVVAVVVEVGGSLMLLIPPAAKKLINLGREEGREQGREEGRKQGREEGRKQGREEGREQERAEWEAWLRRRTEAEDSNLPFDEPPPSRRE